MARILVVEDDRLIASFVEKALRSHRHSTQIAEDGRAALDAASDGTFDLVVLDLGLPEQDGFTTLRALRTRGHTVPVLVLTGQPERWNAAACLDCGADDYMTKPFSVDELLARVRARLRVPGVEESPDLVVGDVRLDLRTLRVTVAGTEVFLTGRELALLEMFLRHPGQVLSRDQLLLQVWGFDFDGSANVVNVFLVALRRKLGEHCIETVRGLGYRFVGHRRAVG